ncbi:peroxidase 2-like [Alnus glutinosa]|uniref:peroxidase 2-like n=1 Tax=Alnus glutinosa TaxID=3517 RepID=UPI002D7911E6|nr:peroxidase 2-like [Alnus glutinosa]
MASGSLFCVRAFVLLALATTAFSQLSPNFYDNSCPHALSTIQSAVRTAIYKERRMGGSLLRLHFHDCFVNGCDGSVLLDSTPTIDSEKTAVANNNSIRGFEVVDNIKSEVDKACGGPVVSCADILAVAARDSVVALGGPAWEVQLGRRDSTTASRTIANADLPLSNMNLPELIDNFKKQGLDETDLVVLSGGHTLGFARCLTFRDRIYKETNIDGAFAEKLKSTCPKNPNDGDSNLASFDPTPAYFDTAYFNNLVQQKGLLHSDQALFSGGLTDPLVNKYSSYPIAFWQDFAKSMVKMGNIKPLTGYQGEIRLSCSKVNQ